MRKSLIRIGLQILASILVILGFFGLFLPFLQGILFLIIGIAIFSFTSPRFKAWLDKRLSRFPKVRAKFDRMHERVTKRFG